MKRHNIAEITLKLQQADEMAFGGQNQAQICKNLGVSVMTLHRWRKLYAQRTSQQLTLNPSPPIRAERAEIPESKNPGVNESSFVQELISENRRLRKIVADLLLEKAKLEEASHVGAEADLSVSAGVPQKLF